MACSWPAASPMRIVAFETGFGAHAGSGGTFSTGHTGPATAVTRIPVSEEVPSPAGEGHASAGTGDPASDWSLTDPSGPTAYVQLCSSMQPAGQSPQPMCIVTRNAPTPEAGVASFQLPLPLRAGSRGGIPPNRGSRGMTRAEAPDTGPAPPPAPARPQG